MLDEELDELAMCRGKVAHPSKAGALRQLRYARARQRNDRAQGQSTVYRCRHCDHWHVGRTMGRSK